MIKSIIKRDGRKVPFNLQKIADAIFKAAASVGGSDHDTALELAVEACEYLENLKKVMHKLLKIIFCTELIVQEQER